MDITITQRLIYLTMRELMQHNFNSTAITVEEEIIFSIQNYIIYKEILF